MSLTQEKTKRKRKVKQQASKGDSRVKPPRKEPRDDKSTDIDYEQVGLEWLQKDFDHENDAYQQERDLSEIYQRECIEDRDIIVEQIERFYAYFIDNKTSSEDEQDEALKLKEDILQGLTRAAGNVEKIQFHGVEQSKKLLEVIGKIAEAQNEGENSDADAQGKNLNSLLRRKTGPKASRVEESDEEDREPWKTPKKAHDAGPRNRSSDTKPTHGLTSAVDRLFDRYKTYGDDGKDVKFTESERTPKKKKRVFRISSGSRKKPQRRSTLTRKKSSKSPTIAKSAPRAKSEGKGPEEQREAEDNIRFEFEGQVGDEMEEPTSYSEEHDEIHPTIFPYHNEQSFSGSTPSGMTATLEAPAQILSPSSEWGTCSEASTCDEDNDSSVESHKPEKNLGAAFKEIHESEFFPQGHLGTSPAFNLSFGFDGESTIQVPSKALVISRNARNDHSSSLHRPRPARALTRWKTDTPDFAQLPKLKSPPLDTDDLLSDTKSQKHKESLSKESSVGSWVDETANRHGSAALNVVLGDMLEGTEPEEEIWGQLQEPKRHGHHPPPNSEASSQTAGRELEDIWEQLQEPGQHDRHPSPSEASSQTVGREPEDVWEQLQELERDGYHPIPPSEASSQTVGRESGEGLCEQLQEPRRRDHSPSPTSETSSQTAGREELPDASDNLDSELVINSAQPTIKNGPKGESHSEQVCAADDSPALSKTDSSDIIAIQTPARPARFWQALVDLGKAQLAAWKDLLWFFMVCVYSPLFLVFYIVEIICRLFRIRFKSPRLQIKGNPLAALSTIMTQFNVLLLVLNIEAYIFNRRERAIWLAANSVTRMYLLDMIHSRRPCRSDMDKDQIPRAAIWEGDLGMMRYWETCLELVRFGEACLRFIRSWGLVELMRQMFQLT